MPFTIPITIILNNIISEFVYRAYSYVIGSGNPLAEAISGILSLAGIVVGLVAEAIAVAVAGAVIESFSLVVVITVVGAVIGTITGVINAGLTTIFAFIGSIVVTVPVAIVGTFIGRRALDEEKRDAWVRNFAMACTARFGTSFRRADLTNANFSGTNLKNCDFEGANVNRTCWYNSQKLHLARFENTILEKPEIRELLITGKGNNKSYIGANLRGANLIYADLSYADLRKTDLSGAILQGANLDFAILTEANAVGADFTGAKMTGTTLEAWNIDSTTILDEVDSRFVYLLENPKPGTDDKERRPSSGEFLPGEFTKLFQEVLNTVDIIFRDGIDWKAFIQSFRQIQVENEGIELSVQSIENKGDGVFVVKVNVPLDADKKTFHLKIVQYYKEQLKEIEEKYKLELKGREKEIDIYRQHYAEMTNMQQIIKLLANQQISSVSNKISEKVVLLKLESLSEATNIFVTAQIWIDNHPQPVSFEGNLPPAKKIIELYIRLYKLCNLENNNNRAGFLKEQVIAFSVQEVHDLSDELKKDINNWFNSLSFLNVANQLRSKLNPSDSIRFIIQTSDIKLKLLPLHLWNFFDTYRKAEIALSAPQNDRLSKSIPKRKKVRVLVIHGNSENIETGVQSDLEALNKLPQAEIKVLPQPNKEELHEQLWHPLGWDIICYSGHSDSEDDGSTGFIEIDETIKINPKNLKSALTNAIEKGLQLAIFNSCKGLGIAQDLAELHIPQIIVMRQPVPDEVAQVFLKNFLEAFANGKSLYNSVREARQKLEGLEDRYPCASWLPVICQNPAEVPLKWSQFPGAGEPQIENLLTQLHRLIEEDYTITPDAQKEALEQVKMITEALQIQDELVDKKQVKTNIILLRGILAGQPAANSLLAQVNEVLTDIYRLCNLN
ncbi:MAG: pentapeptide repeat-containing protein [Rivularia sp. (in: cyanobacteria)]